MRLISCTIENFGKLNNVTYDFSGECNTICEDNGWGKSTLAAFIRVMFYGFKNESKKKLADKERNRYMPWQKGVYGGEIIFKVNDVVYSLRRVFGKKQADDEFLLVRKDTNMECNDFSSDIGDELFKIDAQSFERTVFIGQNDCVTTTTDSINAKIGNLADNTDDINNFETAVARLTAELNNITSTRVTGSIAKRKSKITQLTAQINNYAEIDKTIDEQTKIRDELCEKRENLKASKEKLQEQQKVLSAKKDVQAMKEKYQLLLKECNNKKNIFEHLKEYTIEAGRPDSITEDKLRVIRKHGVGRISINPQTMQQKTLDVIGRRHTVEDVVRIFHLARELGFDNINMDLIAGLPGEHPEEMEDTLRQIKELAPDSLTVHALAMKHGSRLTRERAASAEKQNYKQMARELEEMIEEQGQAELPCQFCDKIYRFSRDQLQELLTHAAEKK